MIIKAFRKKGWNIATVSDLRTPLLLLSTVFFTLGMCIDLIMYIQSEKTLLFVVNGICIMTIPLIWILFRTQKISIDKATMFNVWAVALNLYLSIFSEVFYPGEDTSRNILLIMSVFMIPIIHSGITHVRIMPLLIASGGLLCYIIAAVYLQDAMMIRSIPILTLVLIGGSITVLFLLDVSRSAEHENLKTQFQEQQLIDFFSMHQDEWQKIKEGRVSKEETIQLLTSLEGKTRTKLMSQLKDFVQDEVEMKSVLQKQYPSLTSGELQLCCYIIEGLSVSEISKIREVGTSTITSMRSRLRAKLNIDPKENLRDHLEHFIRSKVRYTR